MDMRIFLRTGLEPAGGSGRLGGERETDDEARAGAWRALDVQHPAVGDDDRPGDGEPETRAALNAGPRVVEPDERLEDPPELRRVDPRAGVLHGELRAPVAARERERDLAAGRRVLDRVVHQVHERQSERGWPMTAA